jgi:hypothetical protein
MFVGSSLQGDGERSDVSEQIQNEYICKFNNLDGARVRRHSLCSSSMPTRLLHVLPVAKEGAMSLGAMEILLLGLLIGVSAIIFLLCLPWLVLYMDKLHLERMDRQASREARG